MHKCQSLTSKCLHVVCLDYSFYQKRQFVQFLPSDSFLFIGSFAAPILARKKDHNDNFNYDALYDQTSLITDLCVYIILIIYIYIYIQNTSPLCNESFLRQLASVYAKLSNCVCW